MASKGFDGALFLKCREKYAAEWAKLAVKYPGTSCEGARFVDNGDGTISDNLTQLVWEQKTALGGGTNPSDLHDADNRYSWTATSTSADGTIFTDFLGALNSSGLAGQHDWRLPTFFELQTLLPLTCEVYPCVADPLLVPSQASIYASASTSQNAPTKEQVVGFGDVTGQFNPIDKTEIVFVRAVRGGF